MAPARAGVGAGSDQRGSRRSLRGRGKGTAQQLGLGAPPDRVGLGPCHGEGRETGHDVGRRTLGAVAAVVQNLAQGRGVGVTLPHRVGPLVGVVVGMPWVRGMTGERVRSQRNGQGRRRHAAKGLTDGGPTLQGDTEGQQAQDQNA